MGCRFYQPFRRTHRHGCMAGYHCLPQSAGIFSLQPYNQSVYMSTLLPIPNLSTFPIAKYTIYQYFPLQNIPSINISHYNSFPLYRHSPLHLISNLSAFPIATNPQSIPFPSISSVGNRGCIRKMSGGGNPPDIHCYSFTSLPDCFGRVTVISHSLQDHCNGYRLPCT